MSQEIDRSSISSTSPNTAELDSQLVWSNPVRNTLNPQITRQFAFSSILLDMAQSAKTPLGVNPFWETDATPPIEWRQWFSILKMAIMARDSIEVDKLLKLKPQPTDLFYPTLPTYEEEFEGETDDEARNREQESLETFYSRIREAGALCKFKDLEEELVKDLFISNMTNTSIQMDLLSEVRTPQQVLNFAINRERGQANQQEILKAHSSSTNWSQVSYIRNKPRTPFTQRPPQQPILPTPPTGKIEPCYKCGQPFIKNHLNMCKAQNFTCKICKKTGHFTSMCKAPMPERRNPTFRQDFRKNTQQQQTTPQTRRVRHVKEQDICEEEEETEEETVDAEAALYIKELMEDWSSVNTIRPVEVKKINTISFNKTTGGECWVKTNGNNTEVDWLADTGSPRSFLEYAKAKEITKQNKESKITMFDEKSRYKCFNNQDIKILGVLHITLSRGHGQQKIEEYFWSNIYHNQLRGELF